MSATRICSLALLSLICLAPATFGADDEGWRLRLDAFYFDPGESPTIVQEHGVTLRTNTDTGTGGGLNAEYRFGPRFGLELNALGAAHGQFSVVMVNPTGGAVVSDTLTMGIVSAGLNVHLAPQSRTDVYVGPLLAYVSYSNLNVSLQPPGPPIGVPVTSLSINIDSDVALGANFGLDIPFGESDWFFHLTVKYIVTSMDADIAGVISESVDYDPLLLGAGFGYRF